MTSSMAAPKSSRKRPLEVSIHDTPYYKMRVILKDLRPHVIQVLKTPDFRNCKAADEIREGMKRMRELYKEMTTDSVKLQTCNNNAAPFSSKAAHETREPLAQQQHKEAAKPAPSAPADGPDSHIQGTYIVGGSAYGWNFVTYLGSKAVYYGQSKEAYRAKHPKSKLNDVVA